MTYLIGQILLCLLAAFVLGFLLGWLLRGIGCMDKIGALQSRLAAAETRAATEAARAKAATAEAEEARRRAAASSEAQANAEAGAAAAKAAAEIYIPGYPVEEIEGIGPGFGRRLRAEGITTTDRLLMESQSPEEVAFIAQTCEVDHDTVRSWATMADLLRIPGVGGQWAELLWRAGISDVPTLARQRASDLMERMSNVDAEEHRVPELPTEDRVAHWIAEAAAAGSATEGRSGPELYVPGLPVEEIEGIGAGFGKRLRAEGIDTTGRLLADGRSAEGRAVIARACDIDEATVRNWLTMADLIRLPGVGGQWAELLWRSGISDVQALAAADARALLAKMEETNVAEHRVPELPTVERVAHWIHEAKRVRPMLDR